MSVISILSRKQVKASVIAAACGALLAASVSGLIAGIGVWHLIRDDGTSRAPSLPVSGVVAADAESAVVPPVTQVERPAALYLMVGSEEQADGERARLAALNQWSGPLEAVVVVAESDAAAADIRRGVFDLNRLREVEGLSPLQIIDLRPVGAGQPARGSDVAVPAGTMDQPSLTP